MKSFIKGSPKVGDLAGIEGNGNEILVGPGSIIQPGPYGILGPSSRDIIYYKEWKKHLDRIAALAFVRFGVGLPTRPSPRPYKGAI